MASHGMFLWLLAPCLLAQGILQTGSVNLAEEASPFFLAAKFGYGVGAGLYSFRVKSESSVKNAAFLEIFLDEDWEQAESSKICARSLVARRRRPLNVSASWSPWMSGELQQSVRPHIWYFGLSRCGLEGNASATIDFEFIGRQHDGSELSIEYRYMPIATWFALLCLTGSIARFGVRCWRFQQRVGALHPVVHALGCAILLQWSAQLLHLVQLHEYERDGRGHPGMETVAGMVCMLSQAVSTTLLVVISQGYTLPGPTGGKEIGSGKFGSWVAVVGLLHLALLGGDKMHDNREKHHEHEGAVGWLIVALRLALYAWFLARSRLLQQRVGLKVQTFLRHFQVAGSLYFLAYPTLFIVVQLFAPYLRHPIMQIGLVVTQLASAFWLSDLFLSKGTTYSEISTLSSSLLPLKMD